MRYTYTLTLDGTEPEGPQSARIEVADSAGNEAFVDSPSIIFDFTSPVIEAASVDPAAATTGTGVRLSVRLSEVPGAAPAATLAGFPMVVESATHPDYEFLRTITGTEPEGVAVFEVQGQDAAGNPISGNLPEVLVDYTPPFVDSITVTPSRAGAGTSVAVNFAVSETLGADPEVTVAGFAFSSSAVSGGVYTVERVISGEEPEGEQEIVIRVEDLAGIVQSVSAGVLVLDYQQPTASNIEITPSTIGLGGTLRVQFTVSETLADPPTVNMGSQPLDLVAQLGLDYTFESVIGAGSPDGTVPITVRLEDRVGQVAVQDLGTVEVDTGVPVVQDLDVFPSIARAGTTVNVSFTVSESLAALPAVGVAGQTASLVASDVLFFEYSRTLDGSESEGDQVVEVTLEDDVGNQGTATIPLRTDFTPPQILSPRVEPPRQGIGEDVYLSFDHGGEEYAAQPIVELGRLPVEFSVKDGTRYTYVRTITGEEAEGDSLFRILAADDAGNTTTDESAVVSLDFSGPVLNSLTVEPALVTVGTTLRIHFEPSEPIQGDPVAFIGSRLASQVTSSAGVYTVEHRMTGDEGEPTAEIRLLVSDVFGNSTSHDVPSPTIDFTPPRATIGVYPIPVPEGTAVEFTGRASTDLSGITSYRWMRGPEVLSTQETFSYAFEDGPGEAVIYLEVTDLVGQSSLTSLSVPTANVSPTVIFDPIPSTVSGVHIVTWRTSDPGTDEEISIVSLILEDQITGMRTILQSSGLDTGRFDLRTTGYPESGYVLEIAVQDKDGGTATTRSNPFIIDNDEMNAWAETPLPQYFNPEFGETTQIRITSTEPVTCRLEVYDSSDPTRITTLRDGVLFPFGTHSTEWDGRIDGEVVDGRYAMRAFVTDLTGESKTVDTRFSPIILEVDTIPPGDIEVDPPVSPFSGTQMYLTGRKEPRTSILVNGATAQIFTIGEELLVPVNLWSEGENLFVLQAVDIAGNGGPTHPVTIVRDTIPPVAPTVENAPTSVTDPFVSLAGTRDPETSLGLAVREPGVPVFGEESIVAPLEPGTAWSQDVSLFVGTNVFRFRAIDEAANPSSPTDVSIELMPSAVPAPGVDATPNVLQSRSLSLSGTKASGTDVRIQGAVVVELDSATTWSALYSLEEGPNTLEFTSQDAVRNQSPAVTRELFVDTVPPELAITDPPPNEVIGVDPFDLVVTLQDPDPGSGLDLGSLQIRVGQTDHTGEAVIDQGSLTVPGLELDEGVYSITVSVQDTSGNATEASHSIYVQKPDTGEPAVLEITGVENPEFSPAINPYAEEDHSRTRLKIVSDQPVLGQMSMFSTRGNLVRTVTVPTILPDEETVITWDGCNGSGQLVGDGIYILEMQLTNFYGRDSAPIR